MGLKVPSARTRRAIEKLQRGDADDRVSAALQLNLDGHPDAIRALQAALEDDETDVRESAAQSLALLGDVGSLEAVVAVAARSDAPWPRTSLWAACALAVATGDVTSRLRVERLLDELAAPGPPEAKQQVEFLRRQLLESGWG